MMTYDQCKKFRLADLIGREGFGVVGNYPPTNWRYVGTRNGSPILEHVKHPSQGVAYPDQGVTEDTVRRIVGAL